MEKAALKNGFDDTKSFCDDVSMSFRDVFDKFDVKYDKFVRTTQPDHVSTVQDAWSRMRENGYIYEGEHSGWYCESEESFLTEKELTILKDESRVSKTTGNPASFVTEKNYMFRLSSFQGEILKWLEGESRRHRTCLKIQRDQAIRLEWITRHFDLTTQGSSSVGCTSNQFFVVIHSNT